jgi:hypothetical protein
MTDPSTGVWCRRCNLRHGYMTGSKVLAQYERNGKGWQVLWICPRSGDVLRTDMLT